MPRRERFRNIWSVIPFNQEALETFSVSRFCECGRAIKVAVNHTKSPNASHKARRSGDMLHSLCRQCFEREKTKMVARMIKPKGEQ